MPNKKIEEKNEVLIEKMTDVLTPGFVVECDPTEAEQLGAFAEDAISEEEAMESHIDENDLTA